MVFKDSIENDTVLGKIIEDVSKQKTGKKKATLSLDLKSRIKNYMEHNNINAYKMSNFIGISEPTIRNIIRGNNMNSTEKCFSFKGNERPLSSDPKPIPSEQKPISTYIELLINNIKISVKDKDLKLFLNTLQS